MLKSTARATHSVTVTLYCFASAGLKCTDKLVASESGYKTVSKTVTFRAGKTDKWTLKLPAEKKAKKSAKKSKRAAIKLSVADLNYKAAKTLK